MKRLSIIIVSFIILSIFSAYFILSHASVTLSKRANSIYASYSRDCDLKTVSMKESTLFGLPLEISVNGRNCAGPRSGGSGYTGQIWDHLFWIGY